MNWRKWLDGFTLAGKGILLATKEKRFWCGFIPAFLFFGFLMNLLSGGFSKFELMSALGFPNSLKIIIDSFIAIFGINQPFLDWIPIFAISTLQGILIGLIILLWNKKKDQNSANLEKAGIIAAKSEKLSIRLSLPPFVFAPVEAGEKVGQADIIKSGKSIGEFGIFSLETVPVDESMRLGFLERLGIRQGEGK